MAEPKENLQMEKIVSLCKRRGFIFQTSEIYGGINGFWDYGPLGAELKRNVKELWWHAMTRSRDDIAGLGQTHAAHGLCGALAPDLRAHHVQEEIGHFGLFHGKVWRGEILPRLSAFITAHPGP